MDYTERFNEIVGEYGLSRKDFTDAEYDEAVREFIEQDHNPDLIMEDGYLENLATRRMIDKMAQR